MPLGIRMLGRGSMGSQTSDDDQNSLDDNDQIYNTINMGLIALAGIGLYRTGALKGIISPLLEVADNIAGKSIDKAGVSMSVIKKWSKIPHLTAEQMKTLKDTPWSAPSKSLFRLGREVDGEGLLSSILSDMKKAVNGEGANFHKVKQYLQGTTEDLTILKRMLNEEADNIVKKRSAYTNTTLFRKIRNFEDFSINVDVNTNVPEARAFKSKFLEELTASMTQDDSLSSAAFKRTGYRKLTLGDVAELEGSRLVLKKDAPIDVSGDLLNKVNDFGKSWENRYKGKGFFEFDDWKNMVIDSSIRINEAGHVIDYRMTNDMKNGFLQSLSNDFRLPGAKFNPFKSIFGLDHAGTEEPFGGFILGTQIDPSITGRAGRYTINEHLTDTFGEDFFKPASKNFTGKVGPKGIAVINGKAYTVGVDERGVLTNVVKLGDGFKLHDITNADTRMTLTRSINAERQMAGLDIGTDPVTGKTWKERLYGMDPKEMFQYLEDNDIKVTPFMKLKYRIGRWLDMGAQEVRMERGGDGSFVENSTIDGLLEKWSNKLANSKAMQMSGWQFGTASDIMGQFNDASDTVTYGTVINRFNYRTAFGQGPEKTMLSNSNVYQPRMYFAQKRHYSASNIKDAILDNDWDKAKQSAKSFFGQYFAGREIGNSKYMSEFFTESSGGALAPWTYLNALTEGIGSMAYQLGLSTESKRNVGSLMSGLLLKRVLPVYMLTQIPGVINYLSEPFFDEDEKTGQPDNLTRWLMRGPVKSLDIKAHGILDTVGITNIFKKAQALVPGSDQINELPFVYQMGLGQTAEEREDYIENGYDPIRKGRYWSLGNTPFTGTKILYWRPNLYKRVQADVMFSDSKWGSRQEYYSNTWYPNPVNPFAPIRHFITDRNHYDKKHYLDRPYLQTAPVGANIPIVGPIVSQTVGSIGVRKMHPEYWENNLEPLPGDELPSPAVATGQVFRPALNPIIAPYSDTDFRLANQRIALAQQADAESRYASSFAANESMRRTIRDTSGIDFLNFSILPASSIDYSHLTPVDTTYTGKPQLPVRNYDRYDGNPYEIYTTPSGRSTIVNVPDEYNLYNINQDLRKWSINKIPGTDQRVDLVDRWTGPDVADYTADNDFATIGFQQQYNTLTDVAGLKGFALRQFVTGEMGQDRKIVDTSSYAYGMNKSFWDQNLGGLGGNLSEITRRFVPDRNKNVDYINPIRNTMPNWMPGSDYFTDFKHGDPYAKIMNGEERLPGEGYERLHGITDIAYMNIGTSYIGYDRKTIIKHLLNADDYTSPIREDEMQRGSKLHKQIEQEWLDSGFALQVEGKISDKRNGIYGQYDAIVHDETSPTGLGIVDIKTVSGKTLGKVARSGKALEEHQKQVNYYLWATNQRQSNGYVYYVDRDNPDNSYMASVKYDQRMLEDSFKNLYGAREDINMALEKGIIGRGDLYKPLDKFRILADVAPYSQEFKDASAALSQAKLTPEEQREATAIRERMKEQKEPLRVYPYKFKTANLKTETVTVKEILDNNTIITEEYGRHHAIKFAGVNVSNSMNELVDTHKEKYKDKRGATRYRTVGTPKAEAARKEIASRIGIGGKITISYDADERNKYSKDSTRSIRAVIRGKHGENINKILLEKGLAKEKKNDDSPAGINARYTSGEIRFGSAMERINHGIIAHIPFIGSKILQTQSPYEAYKRREVYGKDFQSWNHPIKSILIPNIQRDIGELGPISGIAIGAFVGSLFGKNAFGKLVGATIGGTTVAIGKGYAAINSNQDRAWRPERRVRQEALNEYVDTLKYVKNMRLYEQYKQKAKTEDHFDVEAFEDSSEAKGVSNKLKQQELTNYKKRVKLDFKNHMNFDFKYGAPKYVESGMSYNEVIHGINKELAEIQSQRKVVKAPLNAMKAIQFKQQADATMYGYEPGDSLVNIMTALPKKERQYFKHFMDAPEEEKGKILRIAPSYLRRALQSTWGMKVDEKPELEEYFMKHGLPDENWIGWNEDVDMEDVKVKIVHKEKMDPGEFDIWRDTKKKADEVNIPVPNMYAINSRGEAQMRLYRLLTHSGLEDVQMHHNSSYDPKADISVAYDGREDAYNIMQTMEL